MRARTIALALLTMMAANRVAASDTTIGTAPGSVTACVTSVAGSTGTICRPGGDVFADFPPPALLPIYLPYLPFLLQPTDVINSFSWGNDSITGAARIRFSVDGASVGAAGDVPAQAATGDAAADVYTAGTLMSPAINVLTVDGNGLPANGPPALGLVEPGDNLSVLATCGRNNAVAFTLAPGSPTLTMQGATPADVYVGSIFATVVHTAASLGLSSGDVIDALAYDFSGGPTLRFSLAPGSPTLAMIGAGPADILAPGPVVAVSAASLGLLGSDNVDALDISLDPDGDLVADLCDNCPATANNGQEDQDQDTIGDVCDTCTDSDGDGVGDPGFPVNLCPGPDNCPTASNPGQEDADGDGVGNVCDICAAGDDGDDADGDAIPDSCDSCPGFDDADPANPCPTLFGLEYDGSVLRIYNPYSRRTLHTVAVTLAGHTITGGRGLAFDPTSGQMYGLLELMGQAGMELVTIDRVTGVATSIGDTGDYFWGITMDCAGTLYAVTTDVYATVALPPETLYRLDKTTAAPTLVRSLGHGDTGEGIAFRPLDGAIYHASGSNTAVFETVSLPSLAVTDIPLLGYPGMVHTMVYWEANDIFLTSTGFSTNASSITPGGVATYLGVWGSPTPPYAFPYALAFTGVSPACGATCPPTPAVGCAAPQKSLLLLKDKDADGAGAGDKLLWKWLKGSAIAPGDFGNPTTSADYALCVYSGASQALSFVATIEAGGTCGLSNCWSTFGSGGFMYSNAAGSGVTRLTLKDGGAGRTKILLKGRDGGLPLTVGTLPFDGAGDVVVQLVNDDNANCWSATFSPASARKNTGVLYKARTP